MDSNLIYVKTAAGESAIQQRNRMIQRNVRMVLILVDGQCSVADLCRKTGNPQLTENALSELEKCGFVERKTEHADSLWDESKRVAQEIVSAAQAQGKPQQQITEAVNTTVAHYPDFAQAVQGEQPARSLEDFRKLMSERAVDMPISMHSAFDAREEAEFSSSQFSLAPEAEVALPPIQLPDFMRAKEVGTGKVDKPVSSNRKEKPKSPRPSVMEHLRLLWRSAGRELDDEPAKRIPQGRRDSPRVAWGAALAKGLAVLGVVFVLCVAFFPVDTYRPEVSEGLAHALGRPVHVEAMQVEFSRTPGLVLRDVVVGSGGDAVRVREVVLQPDVVSLRSEPRRIRQILVRGAEFDLDNIGVWPRLFSAVGAGQSTYVVQKFRFEKSQLRFGGLVLKDMDAEVVLGAGGALQSLSLRSANNALHIQLEPTDRGALVSGEAFAWAPLEGSKFLFDSVSFKGRIERQVLTLTELELRIFDGMMRGDLLVRGGGAQPNLTGSVSYERMNVAKVTEALGLGRRLTGDAVGTLRFSAESSDWLEVMSKLKAQGDLAVQRGSLVGMDLAEAMRRVSGAPVQGGVTAFEQLTAKIRIAPSKLQLTDVSISSGLMLSSGSLGVDADRRLDGRLLLQLKGSANRSRVPVAIGGTLDAPSVQQAVGR